MGIKEKLRLYKKVKINGVKFVIKKINPLLDFPADKMPQIFTSFKSNRPSGELQPAEMRKTLEDVKNMILAGVVSPKIGEEVDISDIMADNSTSVQLYIAILTHSLNIFRGVKGVFFSIKTRWLMYTQWRKHMAKIL